MTVDSRDPQQPHVERRLAAILVADVAGYSRLMGVDEEATLADLKAHRAERIVPAIAGHNGRLVNTTGDGMLVEFASAVEAVLCAIEFQQAVDEHNFDVAAARRLRFRAGINLGEVIVDGTEIYGDSINVAARLEALADPGGILISGRVHDTIRKRAGYQTEFLGERRVKNIAEPVPVYRVLFRRPTARGRVRRRAGRWWMTAAALTLAVGAAGSWSVAYFVPRNLLQTRWWAPRVISPLPEAPSKANPAASSGTPQSELAYWNSIKDTTSITGFEAYLKRYPKGEFAEVASLEVAQLSAAAAAKPGSDSAILVPAATVPSEPPLAPSSKMPIAPTSAGTLADSHDGLYVGSYEGGNVRRNGSGGCSPISGREKLVVRNRYFTVPYLDNQIVRLSGLVSDEGAMTLLNAYGDVQLSGKIVGETLTADTWNTNCAYHLKLTRTGPPPNEAAPVADPQDTVEAAKPTPVGPRGCDPNHPRMC